MGAKDFGHVPKRLVESHIFVEVNKEGQVKYRRAFRVVRPDRTGYGSARVFFLRIKNDARFADWRTFTHRGGQANGRSRIRNMSRIAQSQIVSYLNRLRVAVFWTILAAVGVIPAFADRFGRLNVIEENDVFFNSDKHYTQGLKLSYVTAPLADESFFNAPIKILRNDLLLFSTRGN
jgi:hypothetical protein